MGEKKTLKSVKITVSGKKVVDVFEKKRGLKQYEVLSRMMLWLNAQDESLQAIILGQLDPVDESAVLSLIKTRISGDEAVVSGDEAVRVATLTQLLMGPATKGLGDVLASHAPDYIARAKAAGDGVIPASEVAAKVRRRKKDPKSSKSA